MRPVVWAVTGCLACAGPAGQGKLEVSGDAAAEVSEAAGPAHVVVMTFNVRTAWAMDGVNSWPNRRDLALAVIRAAGPDILGTQEAILTQVEDLAAGLPGYEHVGRLRSESVVDETCTVFFRSDRFERVADDSYQLSDTPEVVGSKFSDRQGNPRIVTWVRLRDRESGRELVFFNTHWATEDFEDIPLRSARLMVEKQAEIAPGLPSVVVGDFNTTPEEPAYAVLTGAAEWGGVRGNLVDSWRELGMPEEGTSHGFTGVPRDRIDYVFHSTHLHAVSAEVVHEHQGEVWPSDHFPVVAVLAMP